MRKRATIGRPLSFHMACDYYGSNTESTTWIKPLLW